MSFSTVVEGKEVRIAELFPPQRPSSSTMFIKLLRLKSLRLREHFMNFAQSLHCFIIFWMSFPLIVVTIRFLYVPSVPRIDHMDSPSIHSGYINSCLEIWYFDLMV
jgi:hypothetical protein